MNQPRLIVVVLPNKKQNPDLVLRTEAGSMVCAFASWQTLLNIMANDIKGNQTESPFRFSVTVAEQVSRPNGL